MYNSHCALLQDCNHLWYYMLKGDYLFKLNFLKKERIFEIVKSVAKKFITYIIKTFYEVCAFCKSTYAVARKNTPAVRELVVNFLKTADSMKVKVLSVLMATVCCLTITVIAYAVEQKSAVQIWYSNNSYGFVSDMKVADEVCESVRKSVHGKFDVDNFRLQNVTVAENLIMNHDEAVRNVTEGVDSVVSVSGLYVDGILMAVADNYVVAQDLINQGIKHYTADGFEFKGFDKVVTIRDIYATCSFLSEKRMSWDKLISGQYGFGFVTSRVENYDEEIAFEETIKESSKYYTTYKKVTQKGKNGLRNVTAEVQYVNGVKTEALEMESTVITPAVDKVTLVGTKLKPVYHRGYVLATRIMTNEPSQMVFPVDCNGKTYISSFWGDGRGHKGIDIAAPRGTEIYAVADGVVSFVGYRSDYGYLIIVDHPDGKTQTYYSHNSKNLVKKGETVAAGQLIAKVGASGNATGNHLHFAVAVNGTMVDPARMIGLK